LNDRPATIVVLLLDRSCYRAAASHAVQ